MNELLQFFANPTLKDVSFAGFTILILVLVFTGRLIPYGTHKRELDDAKGVGEQWHQAHTVSELARGKLAEELSRERYGNQSTAGGA
jgi:hypothetical protein